MSADKERKMMNDARRDTQIETTLRERPCETSSGGETRSKPEPSVDDLTLRLEAELRLSDFYKRELEPHYIRIKEINKLLEASKTRIFEYQAALARKAN